MSWKVSNQHRQNGISGSRLWVTQIIAPILVIATNVLDVATIVQGIIYPLAPKAKTFIDKRFKYRCVISGFHTFIHHSQPFNSIFKYLAKLCLKLLNLTIAEIRDEKLDPSTGEDGRQSALLFSNFSFRFEQLFIKQKVG